MRDRKFFSIHEINEAIAEKLEELNNRPFQRMAGTRRSAWLEEEKPYMLPLPAVPFETAVWSVAKVPNDYLVSDGRNKYSVPHNLIGENVDIRVTKTTVEVFYHGSPVSEAIMDRIIHNAYEVLVDGRVSMRERNGLKSSLNEGGGEDA